MKVNCASRASKNHKYPNKHEEKSPENANVQPKSAFLRQYLMNEARSWENEWSPGHCLPRSHLTDAHVTIWSSVTCQYYRPLWHHLWPLIGQSPVILASDWSRLSGRLGHSFNIKDCDQLSLCSALWQAILLRHIQLCSDSWHISDFTQCSPFQGPQPGVSLTASLLEQLRMCEASGGGRGQGGDGQSWHGHRDWWYWWYW